MAFNKEIRSPMSETEEMYLLEVNKRLARKYAFDPKFGGRWILFVSIGSMDLMWIKTCRLYRLGQFPGIKFIKCSTAKFNPRQRNKKMGVIIFHCGPYNDSSRILDYGRNVVETLSYFNKCGYIHYKTDIQTAQGTCAPGNRANSMYWIPVPKTSTGKGGSSGNDRRSGDLSAAHAILNKALRLQEDVRVATGGKLAVQLVLDKSQQVFPLSEYALEATDQTKPSRINDFKIRDVLGSGGFAIVFRAYLEIDDHEYAIKRIPLPAKKDKQDKVLREVKVLAKLNHPNIVRYYGCWQETHDADKVRQFDEPWKQILRDGCLTASFQTPLADTTTRTDTHTDHSTHNPMEQSGTKDEQDNLYGATKNEAVFQGTIEYLYIQMELCERQTLKDWLLENYERPKQTVLKYFLDIVNALEQVHDKRMIHRDLKPSNVFFDLDNEFVVKVGDFGLGTIITEDDGNVTSDVKSPGAYGDQHTKNAGTPSYMAPEQRGRGKGTYTYKVDIFSMGLLLFEMLWVMRTAQEKNRTLQDLRKMVFPDGFAAQHPEELALLQMMLHQDPNQRPTTRGIRAQPLLQSLQLPHSVNGIEPEEHFELAFKRVLSIDGPGQDD